jgi:RES domain-containing protein
MGMAKAEMMEAEERGWYALDTFVCPNCVEDEYLKSLIEENLEANSCDYCGSESDDPIAAPTEIIQEAIGSAIFYDFNDPTNAGVPWDEGTPAIKPISTDDMLMSIGLSCHDDLFEAIGGNLINDYWVRTAQGHWLSSHPHEDLSYSWESFVYVVKHKTRYFFTSLESQDRSEYSPIDLLNKLGELVEELTLISHLPTGMLLYRVRERSDACMWEVNATEMDPPPLDKAAAGRMNPAGISYFYLAQELETALSEVLSGPPCEASYAEFILSRELAVIDLCQIPPLPSIFNDDLRDVRERLLFLNRFISAISVPVRKDGGEHIDYAPSQVVSEFFAKVFRSSLGEQIHGMVYPSAVQPGGRNIVLFPPQDLSEFSSLVKFQSGATVTYETWPDFIRAVKIQES